MIEVILRAYILGFMDNWDKWLALVKFAYNNSYDSNIHMAPFEALYVRSRRSPICWVEVNERGLIGTKIIEEIFDIVQLIRQKLKTAESR